MKPIEFSKEEKRLMVRQLQTYFSAELDQELAGLPAEMLIDFIARDIGAAFYNRGLRDAQAVVTAKAEDIADAIYRPERS